MPGKHCTTEPHLQPSFISTVEGKWKSKAEGKHENPQTCRKERAHLPVKEVPGDIEHLEINVNKYNVLRSTRCETN